jgi:ABC-2 type transport system permease protein
MTTSLFQVAIILVIGVPLGINYDALSLLQIISIALILSFGLTSLGLTFGSYIESLEGFQLIVSFVVFPLFFLSGALFPIDNLPAWLSFITLIDPATYSVDAIRNSILHLGTYSFELDLQILLLFTLLITLLGIFSFKRMKAV